MEIVGFLIIAAFVYIGWKQIPPESEEIKKSRLHFGKVEN